jgi:hypothetical protein
MTQQPAKSFHVRRAGIVLLIFLCLLGTAGWARQHLESPDHAGWFHDAVERVHFWEFAKWLGEKAPGWPKLIREHAPRRL